MVIIEQEKYGRQEDPVTKKLTASYRYILKNKNQMTVTILTIGATVQSIKYPDRHGVIEDVCLGFDDFDGYYNNEIRTIGGTVGRVANVVANGKFSMGDKEYSVSKNLNDKHHINGGFIGFHRMMWDVAAETKNGIILQHVNPKGLEGYPGKLTATITFSLDDENNLEICMQARATKKTPINLSNYLFLNLAGHDARKEGLFEHNVRIKSKAVVDCDHEQIPNGSLRPVKYSIFDLRKYVNLGKRLKKFFAHPSKGFDIHYCNDFAAECKPICKIIHPCTGRWLEFSCDQPTVHFLTCNNWPDGDKVGVETMIGKNKAVYAKHGGFCFAAQQYPDAVNNSNFPKITLGRRKTYSSKAVYHFGCAD